MEANDIMLESLYEKTEQFSKTSLELIKLKTVDKSADVISSLAWKLIVTLLIIFLVVNLNIGIALWVGDLLHKTYMGFIILAAFYSLCGIIFYLFRNNWVKKPLRNSVIEQFVTVEKKYQRQEVSEVLTELIVELERKQAKEGEQLKYEFNSAYDSLKPANILKNALKEVTASKEIRNNILMAAMSMATGYVSSWILKGPNFKAFRKISTLLMRYGVSHIMCHPDVIKSIIGNMIQGLFRKKRKTAEE